MTIHVLTIFPTMFAGPMTESILKRAFEKGIVNIIVHDLREWASDKHKSVDSPPYGGGAGMVMRVDVIDKAIEELKKRVTGEVKVILLDTKGEMYNQKKAVELAKIDNLILIAGHYEGIDHRVHEHLADEVICIGPYVLTGGELPAMVLIDSVVRLVPGVLGNEESLSEESYSNGEEEVEYKQYTRPEEYKGWKVPEVLLSGNHEEIKKWRKA